MQSSLLSSHNLKTVTVFSVSGWKLSPVVGAVYGPELYAGSIVLLPFLLLNGICAFHWAVSL